MWNSSTSRWMLNTYIEAPVYHETKKEKRRASSPRRRLPPPEPDVEGILKSLKKCRASPVVKP